jgi:hypothetical protein
MKFIPSVMMTIILIIAVTAVILPPAPGTGNLVDKWEMWDAPFYVGVHGDEGVAIDNTTGIVLLGDSSVWDDLRNLWTNVRIGATPPDFTNSPAFAGDPQFYYYTFDGATTEEDIYFTVQMPHTWKNGSTIYPHIHFTPTTTNSNDTASKNVRWYTAFKWANTETTFSATTTLIFDQSFIPNDSLWKHLVARNSTGILGTGKTLSSILMCRLYRNPVVTQDTYPQDAAFLGADIHYEIDSLGSREEYVK